MKILDEQVYIPIFDFSTQICVQDSCEILRSKENFSFSRKPVSERVFKIV